MPANSTSATTSYFYGTYDFPTIASTTIVSGDHRSVESHIYQYDHKTGSDSYILGSLLSDTKYLIDPVTEKEWIAKQVYTYDQKMLLLSQTGYIGDTSLHKTGETRWTYDDYGNVLTEMRVPFEVSEFIGKPYGYDAWGRPRDLESGLPYIPGTGPELMPDLTQNFNLYSYCLNNPLVYVDENGEFVFTTAIIVGICVGIATPYEKGQQGVEMAIKQVEAEGGVYRGKEVTVRVNGTKVRFDFVADIDGQMTFFEIKNGPHAGFTPNQKIVYPDMLLNKPMVYPVGRNVHEIFQSHTNVYNFVIIKFLMIWENKLMLY